MGDVINYIDSSPNKAIVYLLMVAVASLSAAVLYLFRDAQKQDVKNFDMLIRSLEAVKDNAIEFKLSKEQLKEVRDKMDILLRKHG